MAYLKYIKLGLVCVVIFQIVSLFFLLRVYDKFVSNPDNYSENSLVVHTRQIEETK